MNQLVTTALWLGAYYGMNKLIRYKRNQKRRWTGEKRTMRNVTPKGK